MVEEIAGGQLLVETKIPRAGEPNVGVGSVIEGIDKTPLGNPEDNTNRVVDNLRGVYDEESKKTLGQRAKERGEANREKRKGGFREFWGKVKGAIDNATTTAEGLVSIGAENVNNPQWRAEQWKKVDNAISGAEDRAREKGKASMEQFQTKVNDLCENAKAGVRDSITKLEVDSMIAGKMAFGALERGVIAPLLSGVVEVVNTIDAVDELITDVRAGAIELVARRVAEKASKAYDWINEGEDFNVLAIAAERYRERGTDKKGIGKLTVAIDNGVELVRGQFEKWFGWGNKMKKEAARIRNDFKDRYDANTNTVNAAIDEVDRIKNQGII